MGLIRPEECFFNARSALAAGAELVDFLLGLFLGFAVALLDLAFELFGAAVDLIEIVVGQLAPLLLGFASDLFPVAFDLVAVHVDLLDMWDVAVVQTLQHRVRYEGKMGVNVA